MYDSFFFVCVRFFWGLFAVSLSSRLSLSLSLLLFVSVPLSYFDSVVVNPTRCFLFCLGRSFFKEPTNKQTTTAPMGTRELMMWLLFFGFVRFCVVFLFCCLLLRFWFFFRLSFLFLIITTHKTEVGIKQRTSLEFVLFKGKQRRTSSDDIGWLKST